MPFMLRPAPSSQELAYLFVDFKAVAHELGYRVVVFAAGEPAGLHPAPRRVIGVAHGHELGSRLVTLVREIARVLILRKGTLPDEVVDLRSEAVAYQACSLLNLNPATVGAALGHPFLGRGAPLDDHLPAVHGHVHDVLRRLARIHAQRVRSYLAQDEVGRSFLEGGGPAGATTSTTAPSNTDVGPPVAYAARVLRLFS